MRNRQTLEDVSLCQKSYASEGNLWRLSDDFSSQNQAKTFQIYLNDFSCMYSCKFVLGHVYGGIGRDSIKLPFVARCISCMLLVASYLSTICRAESKSCQSRQMMPLETYFCSFYAKMVGLLFWESTAISRHFLKFLLIGDFQDGWARF